MKPKLFASVSVLLTSQAELVMKSCPSSFRIIHSTGDKSHHSAERFESDFSGRRMK